jgi:3-methylfumaryl-CoA hydratase
VHGPLIATLLLDLLRRQQPEARVTHFEFKALKPVFDTAAFQVQGCPQGDGSARLWAVTPGGELAMQATARWC